MVLALALIIDAVFGEPEPLWRRLPHPVVIFGRSIRWWEVWLNNGEHRRVKGVVMLLVLISLTWVVAQGLSHPAFHHVFEIIGGAILLAHRSLNDHVQAVAKGLGRSIEDGRDAVAMIVGRDTAGLDESGISRAAIESAAENFSDGVVAPAFWFLIGGLPGIAVYKMVNTADSMVGYRNERYHAFGWASARLDDVLNWVPARLSGAIICLVGGGPTCWHVMVRYAGLHRSPNAGWPEAAVAASLGIALSGPRTYEGRLTEDPYVNPDGRIILSAQDIRETCRLLWRAWALLPLLALVVTIAAAG